MDKKVGLKEFTIGLTYGKFQKRIVAAVFMHSFVSSFLNLVVFLIVFIGLVQNATFQQYEKLQAAAEAKLEATKAELLKTATDKYRAARTECANVTKANEGRWAKEALSNYKVFKRQMNEGGYTTRETAADVLKNRPKSGYK